MPWWWWQALVAVLAIVGALVLVAAGALWLLNFVCRTRFPVPTTGAVLITGTSTGIGHDAALFLAQKGYHVRSPSWWSHVAGDLRSATNRQASAAWE